MLDRFLRDGTVIVDGVRGPLGRRRGHRVAYGSGRIGRVRVDPTSGAWTKLYRNKWHAAAAEFGLPDPAAARKLFGRWSGVVDVRSSPGGVYVLEEGCGYDERCLASYNRELELQWRRTIPRPVTGLFVDDSGWIYFGVMGPRVPDAGYVSTKFELIALTPRGEVAWTWVHRPKPPDEYWEGLTVGGLMAMGHDLCFSLEGYSRPPVDGSYPPPELVCVSPRHGQPVE